MERMNLRLSDDVVLGKAEEQARNALPRGGDLSLTAWYDAKLGTGGPMEPCDHEPQKCVRDYARSHGAQYEVSINNERMQLYFAPTPPDAVRLDREQALAVHRGLPRDDSDNQQGG